MQAQELITEVRRELVETVGSFWSDTELLSLLNRAERDFANRTRLLDDDAYANTVAGQAGIPLPSNWVSAKKIFYNDIQNGVDNWRPLYPSNLEKMSQERPNFLSTNSNRRGTPNRYWIWNKTLYFDPIPDTDGSSNVRMFYKSKPITITDSSQEINIDDSLADGLIAYMLWKAWKKEKEPDLADEARDEYLGFVRQGLRFTKKKSGDQRYRIDIQSPTAFGGDFSGEGPLT